MKTSPPYKYGLTPAQIRKAIKGSEQNGKVESTALTPSTKNKPLQALRPVQQYDLGHLLECPYSTARLFDQVPTPEWFTYKQRAEISVIVPVRGESIERLVSSWDFDTEAMRVELIFVDDATDSKAAIMSEWGKRRSEIKRPVGRIYLGQVSQGWGACCNLGAQVATGSVVIFLPPTAKLGPGWISPLVRQVRKPEVGAVTALAIDESHNTIFQAGLEWCWHAKRYLKVGQETYKSRRLSKPFVLTNCPAELRQPNNQESICSLGMATLRANFLEVGGFSPSIFDRPWSDADFSLTLKEKGLDLISQPYSKLYFDALPEQERYPETGYTYFSNKWDISGRLDRLVKATRSTPRQDPKQIMIRRDAAHGDVLLAAAIAPALKKRYPTSSIVFATQCPEMLFNNPWVDKVVNEPSDRLYNMLINLDLVYEYRPNANILAAYAEVAGVSVKDCKCFLHTEPVSDLPEKYVVFHAGTTLWAGRNWSALKFDQVSNRLHEDGYKIVCVGTQSDHKPFSADVDLRGKTTVHQLGYVIQNALAFVGIDSMPMHIAQIFDVPGVAFFGAIKPETRIFNPSMLSIAADGVRCLGCHHRKATPCTSTNTCEVGVQECINGVSVEQMVQRIRLILKSKATSDT